MGGQGISCLFNRTIQEVIGSVCCEPTVTSGISSGSLMIILDFTILLGNLVLLAASGICFCKTGGFKDQVQDFLHWPSGVIRESSMPAWWIRLLFCLRYLQGSVLKLLEPT